MQCFRLANVGNTSVKNDFYFLLLISNTKQIMNKAELINAVAEKSGLSKADSKKAIDAFVATVTDVLKNGDKLSLVGFGSFSVSERAARTGVKPQTKKQINIAAKKVAKVKAGAELADAIK